MFAGDLSAEFEGTYLTTGGHPNLRSADVQSQVFASSKEDAADTLKDLVPVYGAYNRFDKGDNVSGAIDAGFDVFFFLKPLRAAFKGARTFLFGERIAYTPVSTAEHTALEAAKLRLEEARVVHEAAVVEAVRAGGAETLEQGAANTMREYKTRLALKAAREEAAEETARLAHSEESRFMREFFDPMSGRAFHASAFAFDEPTAVTGPEVQKEPVQVLRAEDDETVTVPIDTVQRVTQSGRTTLAAGLLLAAAYIEFRRR